MTLTPLISVVIPAYNHADYLPAALESVIHQTYSHLEIIVVDDGSTDDTTKICEEYARKDKRIKVIRQTNQGPSAARNRAINESQGEYICLLDADDVMDPSRIAVQYEVLHSDKDIDIVYTALRHIDPEGNPCGEMRGQDYPPENFLALMFFRNVIPNPNNIMAKRECLITQPYNETFKHAEDYELMMRLAHIYRFKYIDQPLTSYRRHPGNLSNDLASHRNAEKKVLQQYASAHIAQVVALTSLPEEQKTVLLGKILFNLEHIQEAFEIFKQLHSAITLFYTGNCHLYLSENELAIKAYKESLHIDNTNNPAAHNNYGVAMARRGNKEKATASFKEALKLRPGYLDPQYNLDHVSAVKDLRVTWRELRPDLVPYIGSN